MKVILIKKENNKFIYIPDVEDTNKFELQSYHDFHYFSIKFDISLLVKNS